MARIPIGFTGSRKGLSLEQAFILRDELASASEFHHGDCIGSDAEAHAIALELGIPIIIHPPIDSKNRAFCQGYTEIRKPGAYGDRDKRIVLETDLLIGCPHTENEYLRSGTWATLRFAARMRRPYLIITPRETRNFI